MRIVPPEGPRESLVAIVGEAPGQYEVASGRPFVGPSGLLLNQMLVNAGLDRSSCYITNLSKVQPPKNDFGAMYYDDPPKNTKPKSGLLDIREALWAELKDIRPKVVVAMGNEAMKALTPHSGIMEHRGLLTENFGLRVIPTLHPAYLLRGNYVEKCIVECDLRKAFRQAISPSKPFISINQEPTFSDVMAFLSKRYPRLAMDIETAGNLTRCIGFAWSRSEAISIPLMKGYSHAWSLEEESEILNGLDRLFRDPSVGFIIQNRMFDETILAREFGFRIANVEIDTMTAHHLLYPELPKGLDFLCSIYTDHEHYWGYDKTSWKSTARYNGMDTIVTYEAAEKIIADLEEQNLTEFYNSVIRRVSKALIRVQSRGVKIDEPKRLELKNQTEVEMSQIRTRLESTLGRPLNPASPKQVSELVYREWKLPLQTHPKTKKPTTDDDALRILARKNPPRSPVILDIIEHRQKKVLISTFIDQALDNGRAKTSYNPSGTVTGRLASSRTIDGLGGNQQNIPRGSFRRIYLADEGNVLIKGDLSQAEYRVLIWKAKILRVINRWTSEPGFNIHMWNASENIYRVPISQVTKKMYSDSKNGVYGANYGIGALKVSRMYNIDFQDAKFIIERYHEAVPEVKEVYQKGVENELMKTRTLVNPLGRKRVFMGRMDDETFRAAYSHYCQSTVADLINLGLSDLVEWGVDVLLQVHDEIVIQAPVSEAIRAAGLMKKALERPIMVDDNPIPLIIPCEIKIGPNWHDTVPLTEWEKRES